MSSSSGGVTDVRNAAGRDMVRGHVMRRALFCDPINARRTHETDQLVWQAEPACRVHSGPDLKEGGPKHLRRVRRVRGTITMGSRCIKNAKAGEYDQSRELHTFRISITASSSYSEKKNSDTAHTKEETERRRLR